MAKKLYYVHECFQDRHWFIVAKNKKEAQRLIMEEHTDFADYDNDSEYEFEFQKHECFEIKSFPMVSKA